MINEQRMLDRFIQLIQINSPGGKEGKVADYVENELKTIGFEVFRDDANARYPSDTGNVIGFLKATKEGGTPIFFSSHMDTVQPTEGIHIIQENGVIKTDGTTILGGDDKSGIAAILEAFQHIQEEKIPHGDIQVILTISEEVGLRGARALDPRIVKASMGYVLDSNGPIERLITRAPSHDLISVEIIGKAAHAGMNPEEGISAIQVASDAISHMKLGRIDEETTANIGTIRGGEARNIVAERVSITAEARSRNADKLAVQVQQMLDAFQQAADRYGAKVEVKVDHSYSTFVLTEDDLVVQIAMQAVREIGLQPELGGTGGGSDANVFNLKGIPSIVVSTGMDKVHSTQERIRVVDMMNCTKLVVAITQEAAKA